MFLKKVFQNCPRCFIRLNPSRMIGTVGICDHCGWAGSPKSEKYHQKIQGRVTRRILLAGLLMIGGIYQLGRDSGYEINPRVSKWLNTAVHATDSALSEDPNH